MLDALVDSVRRKPTSHKLILVIVLVLLVAGEVAAYLFRKQIVTQFRRASGSKSSLTTNARIFGLSWLETTSVGKVLAFHTSWPAAAQWTVSTAPQPSAQG